MRSHGWGRYPAVQAERLVPLSHADVRAALVRPSLIARGLGRSYGDSSLAPVMLATQHLDCLLGFDADSGYVRCAAGVSLADMLHVFVPRGWFLPVTPGTKFVTLGGAIASDVHGKNHHQSGCFSEFVESVELLLANGEICLCSPTQQADLFRATCGGMGLTGIILAATLRLKRISSASITQTTLKARNLDEVLEQFNTHRDATYSVAWIDCLAQGTSLGRSLLMLGEHAAEGALNVVQKKPLPIPFDMPSALLNPHSIAAFNALYYQRVQQKISQQRVHYDAFFYPLDGLSDWNRLYGKNGFTQYQFVIPKAAGIEAMRAILQRIAEARRGAFLAVLKVFGKQNSNLLSFPVEGYCLALDFKIEAGLFELLNELDAMVLDYGGRLYLAKDARMSAATFKQSYPHWQAFQAVREQYAARGKFASLQSHRLGLD